MYTAVTRRQALRSIGLLAAGTLAGCTPVRIALKWAPANYSGGAPLVDRVLRAFVATVLPGADPQRLECARVFVDANYPFASYASTFAADLSSRAHHSYGAPNFALLGPAERTAVVQAALRADAATRKLYTGAIFLAQVAFYSGFYDDGGCSLIGFEGRFRSRPVNELGYADPAAYMARATSRNGNPN
jgi:hypothetical protein